MGALGRTGPAGSKEGLKIGALTTLQGEGCLSGHQKLKVGVRLQGQDGPSRRLATGAIRRCHCGAGVLGASVRPGSSPDSSPSWAGEGAGLGQHALGPGKAEQGGEWHKATSKPHERSVKQGTVGICVSFLWLS